MYQSTKRVTQRVADVRSANGSRGYAGVCFRVRNSAYGLSSETWGRLNEGITPSHCKVEIIGVAAHRLAIVGVQYQAERVDVAFCASSANERSSDVRRFAFGDLPANDATAPDVHDQVEVQVRSTQGSGQPGDVPTPYLVRTSRLMDCGGASYMCTSRRPPLRAQTESVCSLYMVDSDARYSPSSAS